ncbi:MAG: (Fe-S)-binding protein, partial [Candidatus Methanomethylophilaceae archaeon]|nr:(Fe-S)-binding protein [Candidatus Methanomethylophilaceae archaeon]
EYNRKTSHCCGGGGGVRSAYPQDSMNIANTRLDEAPFADLMITTCPFCVNNLDSAKGDRKMQVRDLVEIIDELL